MFCSSKAIDSQTARNEKMRKADEGTRTLDRPFTKRVLYQLSYIGLAVTLGSLTETIISIEALAVKSLARFFSRFCCFYWLFSPLMHHATVSNADK
jgi:hypothetical protein